MQRLLGGGILSLCLVVQCTLAAERIPYFQTDARYAYRIQLLERVLKLTEPEYGPFELVPVSQSMTQARGLELLRSGRQVRVAFVPTNWQREQALLPIRVPILRGILGYRVFLIRESTQPAFAAIHDLESLRTRFTAGFGSQWADKSILEANGIRVRESANYETLFRMLSAGRLDFFPRGINEAWRELEHFGAQYPKLKVESRLAFYYPYPVYYFVNRGDERLAARIEAGLKRAWADGSFQRLFDQYHQQDIERARLTERRVFLLDNPEIPTSARDIDAKWWVQDLARPRP